MAERRPFLREGDQYFRALSAGEGEGAASLFTPQRIPQFDTGLKLYGKLRPSSDVGVLSTFSRSRRDLALQWRESLSPRPR